MTTQQILAANARSAVDRERDRLHRLLRDALRARHGTLDIVDLNRAFSRIDSPAEAEGEIPARRANEIRRQAFDNTRRPLDEIDAARAAADEIATYCPGCDRLAGRGHAAGCSEAVPPVHAGQNSGRPLPTAKVTVLEGYNTAEGLLRDAAAVLYATRTEPENRRTEAVLLACNIGVSEDGYYNATIVTEGLA